MRKVYVASSWRNDYQPNVVTALRAAGHEVYDFRNPAPGDNGFHWSEIDPEWQAWTPADFRDHLAEHPLAIGGYGRDMDGLRWADTCVLLMPCGRSAHLEAGWAAGAGLEVHILMPMLSFEPELMYRMAHGIHVSLVELLQALESKP